MNLEGRRLHCDGWGWQWHIPKLLSPCPQKKLTFSWRLKKSGSQYIDLWCVWSRSTSCTDDSCGMNSDREWERNYVWRACGVHSTSDERFCEEHRIQMHVWQSWVENEHYSDANSDYITMFKALYGGRGSYTQRRYAWIPAKSTWCIWAPLLTEVLCCSTLNVVTRSKNWIMFDFYPRLPHVCVWMCGFAALLVLTIHVERRYYSAWGVFRGRERVNCVMMIH